MIEQDGADPRALSGDVDVERAECGRRADAGSHQDGRRTDRRCRERDAPTIDTYAPIVFDQLDGDGAACLDDDTVDQNPGADREVRSQPGGSQVGERRRHAHSVDLVAWKLTNSGGAAGVHVVDRGMTGRDTGCVERHVERLPPGSAGTSNRHRPAGAVDRRCEFVHRSGRPTTLPHGYAMVRGACASAAKPQS